MDSRRWVSRVFWGCGLTVLGWGGCARHATVRAPEAISPEQIKMRDTASHLLGIWENPGRGGKTKQMIFEPGGVLRFEGGMTYFNPGQWTLDTARAELILTLPQAPDENLQIFKLYVGQGVKTFDRIQKRVTYLFDEHTWSLNVGGWIYAKPDNTTPNPSAEAEPVFK